MLDFNWRRNIVVFGGEKWGFVGIWVGQCRSFLSLSLARF